MLINGKKKRKGEDLLTHNENVFDKIFLWHSSGLEKRRAQQTYPEQDHFGRVFQDLCKRVGLRLLGSVRWLDGNRTKRSRVFSWKEYSQAAGEPG